jgi:hypothetical protein
MSNLLALLKRIQFHSASDYDECPACYKSKYDTPKNGHFQDCELKAQIDRLEAENAREKALQSAEKKYTEKLSGDIEYALKLCGFKRLAEPPTAENTNEGHA